MSGSKHQNRVRFPTATVHDYRLPIWPLSRLEKGERPWVETKWGSVKIERGSPTARHRDYLDAIIACHRKSAFGNGELHLAFDIPDIKKILHTASDWSDIRKMLVDLMATVVSVRKRGDPGCKSWQILSLVDDSMADAERRSGQFHGKLKKIVFHKEAVDFLFCEARIFLPKETTKKVLGMRHQVSRSVARWALSHSNDQRHKIFDVFAALGLRCGDRGARTRISQLIDDADRLADLGIRIGDGYLEYRRRSGCVFIEGALLELDHECHMNADHPTAVVQTEKYETDRLTAVTDRLTAVADHPTAVPKGIS